MTRPDSYSFTRYLAAKKSIDDRALNRYVWEELERGLPASSPQRPLQVVEVGAGIGTMIERMLERGLLRCASYTAIDNQEENIRTAQSRLEKWGRARNMQVASSSGRLLIQDDHRQLQFMFENIDLFDFLARRGSSQPCDLLLAHAFLDLVDVPGILPDLLGILSPEGRYYFSLNFDGLTLFEPPADPELDELIPILYHQTMDERLVSGRRSGDSRTGRHLFAQLKDAGADILAAGASDWVVFPQQNRYPDEEAYFLHFIIHTVHQALSAYPELDRDRFEAWVAERHAQIERGELIYIAHQLDIFGNKSA